MSFGGVVGEEPKGSPVDYRPEKGPHCTHADTGRDIHRQYRQLKDFARICTHSAHQL